MRLLKTNSQCHLTELPKSEQEAHERSCEGHQLAGHSLSPDRAVHHHNTCSGSEAATGTATQRLSPSQNHRMVGAGRDLCGSSSPTPPPKQGHLQQAAQDLVQVGLEYLQRRRIHSLPGQPVPVLRHPQREEILPHSQTELPVFQFVPIAPCPVAEHHWKYKSHTKTSAVSSCQFCSHVLKFLRHIKI